MKSNDKNQFGGRAVISGSRRRVAALTLAVSAAALAVSAVQTTPAVAAPYPSAVNVSGTTVTFRLNEVADALTYSINGGPEQALPTSVGVQTFSLNDPSDSFQIFARKTDTVGYSIPTGNLITGGASQLRVNSREAGFRLISSDLNANNRFNSARGVAVNRNANSQFFGTTYVSNSAATNTAAGTATLAARTGLGDGLYAVNADGTDTLGTGSVAQTGGITAWTTTPSTNAPYRLSVGPDNNVYIADFSDATGNIWKMNPNLTNGQNVFAGIGGPTILPSGQNHGSSTAVYVEGTEAGGDLTIYTLDEDLTSSFVNGTTPATADRNSLWRYNVGSGPLPHSAMPTRVNASVSLLSGATSDFDRGQDGKWYMIQNRSAGAEAGLTILSPTGGSIVFDSLQTSRAILGSASANDMLTNVVGTAVSPDQKYIALMLLGNRVAVIPLIDGIPNLAARMVVNSAPTQINTGTHRDITFDAAGNIHYVSQPQGLLRVLSPGGTTDATYSYSGSTGTFSITANAAPQQKGVSGNYSDAANWVGGVPTGASRNATFATLATSPATVTIDAPLTLGTITLAGSQSYTLDGANNIRLENGSDVGAIFVMSGSHTISAPIELFADISLATLTGSTLNITSPFQGGGSFRKFGGGTVVISADNAGYNNTTILGAGTLAFGNGGTTGDIGSGEIQNAGVLSLNRSNDITFVNNILGTGAVSKSGTGTTTFTGNLTYAGNTTVNAGKAVFNTPIRQLNGTVLATGSLSVFAAASVALDAPAQGANYLVVGHFNSVVANGTITIPATLRSQDLPKVLVARSVSVLAGATTGTYAGQLDLGNNDLILRGATQTVAAIRAIVAGGGIVASGASPAAAPFTTLSVFSNNDGSGNAFYTSYDGVTGLGANDIIVKFTYVGDTDLSGYLDANDLINVIEGFSNGLSGWNYGDVNHSGGAVDIADVEAFLAAYAYVTDSANNAPSLGTGAGVLAGGGVIPEPGAIGLLLAAAPLATRRRRRA